MLRALAFIFVCLLELVVDVFVVTLAPITGAVIMLALSPLHERLRPPPPIDGSVDLRVFYKPRESSPTSRKGRAKRLAKGPV